MNRTYYSQNGQDFLIDLEIFDQQRNGFFMEIGAYDGIKYSNTYFLESKRGWNGICIEANPKVYPDLKRNRSCVTLNACLSTQPGVEEFLCMTGKMEMLSGLKREFSSQHLLRIENELKRFGEQSEIMPVNCYTFEQLVLDHSIEHIDYLSIDTEGSEFSIIKSIDFSKTSISVISVENTYHNTGLNEYMVFKGYKKVARIGEDDVFVLL
ncbi:FkbM family methyltransferase [Pedobacter miscanthi]|uniref:Methyltransferase FkbM domain-containing protein n=1 Tax=Pedobacter miscanthi TaxID=2259170 RepID=A0A366LCJ0_9SPHI|nr:FkbM family methyltransferase [Pedobacter miscanthi]RBQ11500.1 hypothetical protein DRW42_03290 [Pedobacter miscanthi]